MKTSRLCLRILLLGPVISIIACRSGKSSTRNEKTSEAIPTKASTYSISIGESGGITGGGGGYILYGDGSAKSHMRITAMAADSILATAHADTSKLEQFHRRLRAVRERTPRGVMNPSNWNRCLSLTEADSTTTWRGLENDPELKGISDELMEYCRRMFDTGK